VLDVELATVLRQINSHDELFPYRELSHSILINRSYSVKNLDRLCRRYHAVIG